LFLKQIGFEPVRDLLFGSDGMPHGAAFALHQSLFPACPGQRLSLDEFIHGYCVEGFDHGYIEIEIDEKRRRVDTAVRIQN